MAGLRSHQAPSPLSNLEGWRLRAWQRWGLFCTLLLLSLGVMLTGCQPPSSGIRWGEEQKLFAAAWTYVDRAYVDPSFNHQNWWMVRQRTLAQPLADRAATYQAIETMVESLGDPFTRFLDPDHYQSLQTSTSGELSGVGLQIAIDESERVMVITPIEGTPADQAGLQPNDQILAIDEQPVRGLSLDQIAEKMRGPSGTTVQLTLLRDHRTLTIPLIRESIAINPVRSRILPTAWGGQPIAYIRLSQFNGNAAQQVKEAIFAGEAEQVRGYVLDLRNDPGGLLQAAIEIAQMWIPQGDLVLVTDRHGIQDSISAHGQALTTAPLVVLVNQGSASASEVLAGALQDRGRGLLVGSQTFGKGLIQSLFQLPDGSGLAVTTAKYLTPSGRDINKLGIHPDVVVDLPSDRLLTYKTLGTDADPQFTRALEVLRQQITTANAA